MAFLVKDRIICDWFLVFTMKLLLALVSPVAHVAKRWWLVG